MPKPAKNRSSAPLFSCFFLVVCHRHTSKKSRVSDFEESWCFGLALMSRSKKWLEGPSHLLWFGRYRGSKIEKMPLFGAFHEAQKHKFATPAGDREGVGGPYFGEMITCIGEHFPKIWASNSLCTSPGSSSYGRFLGKNNVPLPISTQRKSAPYIEKNRVSPISKRVSVLDRA